MSEPVATAPGIGLLQVELEVPIAATREKVFHALTGEISVWWGAPYLVSQTAKSLSVEPRVGVRLKAYVEEGIKYGIGHESASAVS